MSTFNHNLITAKNIKPIIVKNRRNKKHPIIKPDSLIKKRHVVENFYSWKNWNPRLFFMFDKNPENYNNLLKLVIIKIILSRKK